MCAGPQGNIISKYTRKKLTAPTSECYSPRNYINTRCFLKKKGIGVGRLSQFSLLFRCTLKFTFFLCIVSHYTLCTKTSSSSRDNAFSPSWLAVCKFLNGICVEPKVEKKIVIFFKKTGDIDSRFFYFVANPLSIRKFHKKFIVFSTLKNPKVETRPPLRVCTPLPMVLSQIK